MITLIHPCRKPTTLRSKSSMPLPNFEIRKHVPHHTAWPLWLEINNNAEIAKVYACAVDHVLSSITGLHMSDLRTILKHRYLFPHDIVEDFIQFIIQNETVGIEFEQTENGTRKPFMYLSPRSNVTVIGEYSLWRDDGRLKVKGRGQR
jgi:hypothetical protein